MIKYKKIDSVAKVILNRPEKFNCFIKDMALELQRILNQCENDDTIRCVLIVGSGKAFCAGQDLKEAMLKKDSLKMEVCRSIKSAILLSKTEKKSQELTEGKEIEILQKLYKQRQESLKIYQEAKQNKDIVYW